MSIESSGYNVLLLFSRVVNAMVYYGLSLGTDNLGGDPYINFMIAGAVEIPAYILCVIFLNKLGRRWPLFGTMAAGGVACIISAFIPKGISCMHTSTDLFCMMMLS